MSLRWGGWVGAVCFGRERKDGVAVGAKEEKEKVASSATACRNEIF